MPSAEATRIFNEALEVEREKRSDFVSRASKGDAALQAAVEALLLAHDRMGSFLEAPASPTLSEAVRAGLPKAVTTELRRREAETPKLASSSRALPVAMGLMPFLVSLALLALQLTQWSPPPEIAVEASVLRAKAALVWGPAAHAVVAALWCALGLFVPRLQSWFPSLFFLVSGVAGWGAVLAFTTLVLQSSPLVPWQVVKRVSVQMAWSYAMASGLAFLCLELFFSRVSVFRESEWGSARRLRHVLPLCAVVGPLLVGMASFQPGFPLVQAPLPSFVFAGVGAAAWALSAVLARR